MSTISHITLPDGTDYSIQATGIFYGEVDSTSTSTVFTATIPGITEYYDGLTVLLKNGVVTSASGFTININGLGAKGSYSNQATGNPITPTSPTRDTTIFNINYTMMFIYCSTLVSGGCWIGYRGYDANTNTIGYQLRTNSSSLPMTSTVYRYRMLFTSPDNAHFVPANNSTSTNATTARTITQEKINPFGRIVYYGTTAMVDTGARPSVANLWDQYQFTIGYSYVVALTAWKPVYLKCTPQTDGSAIIDSTTPFVQDLPTTEDGKIYIFLGIAYSTTQFELLPHHPVFYYKDGVIRLWTNSPTVSVPVASDSTPAALGTASAGSSAEYSRADHVHAKPTYSASDVGLGNVDNVQQYSASNPPPYPVTSVNGSTGAVTLTIPTKVSDLTNDTGFITGLYIASYGSSTFAEVEEAYTNNKIVYCKASSNADPSIDVQRRMAFLAYVNINSSDNLINEFEFQYYRSVSTHTDAQQGDQVFIYKLNRTTGWSVTAREAYTKIATGTGLSKSYSNGTLTISNSQTALPTVSASDNGKILTVVNGAWAAANLPTYQGGVS